MSNTLWTPKIHGIDAPIYKAIADALEHDVESGVLREGARLPTHRALATKLRVTPLTITRAYKEAARRGLIDSTVGRGTFVRTASSFDSGSHGENAPLDLAKNIVSGNEVIDLDPRLLGALRQVVRETEYQPAEGALRHRIAASAWIARSGLQAPAERIVITPGAQQAIVAILAALCAPGDTVLAEEWTYPRFGAIAGLLRLKVQPVSLDAHGIVPQSFEKACKRGVKALYAVPNFQNPTGSVMPEKRRRDIAAIARRHDVHIIEDDVYGFLLPSPPPPIASLAPDITSFVTSTSKSISPSLRLGFAALPESMVDRVTSACGALTAFTSSAAAEIFTQIFESGMVDRVVDRKRSLVATNRRAAERAIGDGRLASHPMSPHLWIELPRGADAHDVADRARLRGVEVAPASAFSTGGALGAMRVSIGATADAKQLESALRLVASLVAHPRMTTATVV